MVEKATKETTRVVLLGTGTPIADPERSGPSVAVVVGDTPYILDFGPGVVRRVEAARRTGIEVLSMDRLTRAFATHLHSDHTAGFADLILTPWVLGRREPLEVYGPTGIRAMTGHLLDAYQADIHERRDGLEQADPKGLLVSPHEIAAGIVYEDSNISVEAFPVLHGSWQAFGYKFTTPDRTVVVSGDTAPTNTIVEKAQGCDVLVHEVYSTAGFAKGPPHWQTYHSSMHTSSRELAEIASRARPGLLVLYHQLFWATSEEALLEEVRVDYDGEVVSGRDLDVY
ncbi:MBL fold metallo-hydrolase [Thermodesulfobacteriota bacterium]